MELTAAKERCLSCRKCLLCQTRRNVVYGVGPHSTPIMFIGEGPGQQEDFTGEPFVGAAGQFLDRMLSIIGLGRHNCYIANTVKCRPPGNRDPLLTEQDACYPWLQEQIDLIKPKIIICLGRIAAMKMIREDYKITKEHGEWFQKGNFLITAVYHPALLLRDPRRKEEMLVDMKKIKEKLDELVEEKH